MCIWAFFHFATSNDRMLCNIICGSACCWVDWYTEWNSFFFFFLRWCHCMFCMFKYEMVMKLKYLWHFKYLQIAFILYHFSYYSSIFCKLVLIDCEKGYLSVYLLFIQLGVFFCISKFLENENSVWITNEKVYSINSLLRRYEEFGLSIYDLFLNEIDRKGRW